MQVSNRLPSGWKVVNRDRGSIAPESLTLRDRLEESDVHLVAIRHGQSLTNAKGKELGVAILCGQAESDLSVEGRSQAWNAAAQLYQDLGGDEWMQKAALNPQLLPVLYCSPQSRARDTAQATATFLHAKAEQLGLEVNLRPTEDARLKEMAYGDFELNQLPDVRAQEPQFIGNWDGYTGEGCDFLHRFPHGESRSDVMDRTASFLGEVATRDAGRTVVMFAHLETIVATEANLGLLPTEDGELRAKAGEVKNATPMLLT